MPRPRRNTNPEYIRLVTIRTENSYLYMVPDKELNEIVGGVIAKYQQEQEVIVYGYIFLSNHYHLLVRAPKENLWRFEQSVNREIAKRVNRLRNREGHFWGRRYDEQITVEPSDTLAALMYVIFNAVKHGLVKDPHSWPGISCLRHLITGKDREFYFTDYTSYRKAKLSDKKACIDDFKKKYILKISTIPILAKLSHKQRLQYLRKEIQKELLKYDPQKFLETEKIINQNPFSRPRDISRSNRPVCYTKSFITKMWFIKEVYTPWREWFEQASRSYRSGELEVEFPPHSIKPSLLYSIAV